MVKARTVRLKRGSKGADAHLRYLQRDGIDREGENWAWFVERIAADHWRIPEDFETRAADCDAKRRGRISIRLLTYTPTH